MTKIKKILIIRFSSIGDVVLTNFIYKSLKKKFDHTKVYSLIKEEYKEILQFNPYIDKIVSYNKRKTSMYNLIKHIYKEKFDVIIDLHNNLRSNVIKFVIKILNFNIKLITYKKESFKRWLLIYLKINLLNSHNKIVEKYAETLSIFNIAPKTKNFIVIPEFIIKKVEKLLKEKKIQKGQFYAISTEANWPTKRWDKYRELIKYLIQNKKTVVLLGKSKSKLKIKNKYFVDFTKKLSLLESACVIKMSRQFIGNDTGLMHIADAFNIPLVSIWGPTVQEFGFFPINKTSRVVENKNLSCRPCSLHGSKKCPKSHFKCMKEITLNKVLNYVK